MNRGVRSGPVALAKGGGRSPPYGRITGGTPVPPLLLHVALLPEVVERLVRALEDAGGGLGDEGAGHAAASPDDEDFLAAFERVVELALDAAGEAGLTVGEL